MVATINHAGAFPKKEKRKKKIKKERKKERKDKKNKEGGKVLRLHEAVLSTGTRSPTVPIDRDRLRFPFETIRVCK